jgi:hypothetical protein
MPATVFPCPISADMVRDHFGGLGDFLTAMSAYSSRDPDTVLLEHARAAQDKLETLTTIPFFTTRYCTHVLASQNNLALGTDFDRYTDAQPYDVDRLRAGLGNFDLPYLPLQTLDAMSLSLSDTTGQAGSGKIGDIPLEWVERDYLRGRLFILPHGQGLSLVFSQLGFLTYTYSAWMTGIVPAMIHVRFSAGLVDLPADPADYDPETAYQNTKYWPELVLDYQRAISQHAAGLLMRKLLPIITAGGTSVSLDGLSESVNPALIADLAKVNLDEPVAWASAERDTRRGIVMAVA